MHNRGLFHERATAGWRRRRRFVRFSLSHWFRAILFQGFIH